MSNAPNSMNANLNSNMAQTSMQNNNNCWSNLPPSMNNNAMQMRAGGSTIANGPNNAPTGITLKLMQEQNPILNAQLSQDSISYVQIQPSHSQAATNPQQQASSLNSSNQSLPPSSNSPSLSSGLSMRFNRNSPVLTTTSSSHLSNSQQAQPQYPSSPNFMNSNLNNSVHSPTQPMNRNAINQNQINQNQMGQMQPAGGQQRLQPTVMQGHRMTMTMNTGQPAQQTYYPASSDNLVSSNQMNVQASGQQVVYGNCVMNNVNTNSMQPQQSPNMSAGNVASSEMVKQGLRAKLGARSHQQMNSNNGGQTMQSRGQMPMMQQQASPMQQQQSSPMHMTHSGHIQSNSNAGPVHHLQMQPSGSSNMSIQQNSSQVPVSQQQSGLTQQTAYGNASGQMASSQQHSPQPLNSALTDEDLDAIGLALSVNDSSFFSFNDLPETNTMVSNC